MIEDGFGIDYFCVVSGNVTIGRNVHFAVFNNVAGADPGIVFEDFLGFAYGCNVFAQSNDYSGQIMTNPTVPDIFKRERKAPVRIGRHCIIGTSTMIGPGITVDEGTAVGNLSFVSKSTDEWCVYLGAPAMRIKSRSMKLLVLEKQFLASCD